MNNNTGSRNIIYTQETVDLYIEQGRVSELEDSGTLEVVYRPEDKGRYFKIGE